MITIAMEELNVNEQLSEHTILRLRRHGIDHEQVVLGWRDAQKEFCQ